jgi:hypothetical protein
MDVSSRITAAVSHLAAVSSTARPERVESPPPPPENASSTELSRPARLISKLSQLRDSAPDQFKQAVSTIASELRSVSEQDSGMGAKMLVDLANKLDQAADEVDVSARGARSGAAVSGGQDPAAAEDAASGAATSPTSEGARDAAPPRAIANRAAVDAYRATAAAHDDSVAGPGLARAIESVDAAATGAEPRRR